MKDAAKSMPLLEHLPRKSILDAYARAAGKELDGKASSPESSSALVANAFGLFLDRPALLPPLPTLEDAGWPAIKVELERNVRFPWRGGLHPWLDVLIETSTHVIGVESKRYEPYRGDHTCNFSDAFGRDVWVTNMAPYLQLLRDLKSGDLRLVGLDAAQLIKHALALSTHASRVPGAKRPTLVYLYADPLTWPDGQIVDQEKKIRHLAHLRVFSERISEAHVRFVAITYRELFRCWQACGPEVQHHAAVLTKAFGLNA